MKFSTFLFFGSPGSGKGTHGRILGSIPGFCHVACGDVFRSLDMESALGKAFAQYSSKGKLVPDGLVMELWQSQIRAMVAAGRFKPEADYLVLDGIPRNVAQARLLAPFLDVKKVFHLTCPNEKELVARMRRRALKDNRLDDADEKVIRHRLAIYKSETKPVLDYYGARRTVAVYTTRNPYEVFREILGQIEIPGGAPGTGLQSSASPHQLHVTAS